MTKRKKKLLERILAVKDSFIELLYDTTPYKTTYKEYQNTMSEEEGKLMDEILALEEEIAELK